MRFLVVVVILAGESAGRTLSGDWNVMMNPDFKGHQTVEHCVIREAKGAVEVRCGSGSGKAMHGVVTGRTINWKSAGADGVEAVWEGELNQARTRIAGTWRFRFSNGAERRGRFTAQRSASQ